MKKLIEQKQIQKNQLKKLILKNWLNQFRHWFCKKKSQSNLGSPFCLVGKPIKVEKIENPTNEQVESLHKKYVDSLIDLFNEYNPIYGVEGAEIEIYQR